MQDWEPELGQLSEFLAEFNGETDRGAALAAAALLDERLYEILKAFVVDVPAAMGLLSGLNAPLGTFSSRIAAAYSLGLIQENEYRELNLIRRIRNEFAHSWKDTSFASQKTADLCRELPWLGPRELEEESDLRARFNFAVVILLTDLMWRTRLVRKEKRSLRIWPNRSRQG